MSDKIVDQPIEENKPVQVRRSQRIQERNKDAAGTEVALQRIESLVSVYHTAPEALWQTAATRALEVNALLLAAVVGEQQQHRGRKAKPMRVVVEQQNEEDVTTSAPQEEDEK